MTAAPIATQIAPTHDKQMAAEFLALVDPAAPTRDDALKAADELLAPFGHYTFEDPVGGPALLLGMLLTAIERPFLPTAPMFVVRASMPGVGKGLLVRATATLAFNSLPVIATWGHSDEEFSKRLDALLLQSPAIISIDNANGRLLCGDALEAILSEGVADVRPLGRSETVRVRNRSFITATGKILQSLGIWLGGLWFSMCNPSPPRPSATSIRLIQQRLCNNVAQQCFRPLSQ